MCMKLILVGGLFVFMLVGCVIGVLVDMLVVDYCVDVDCVLEDVCCLKVEIDGNVILFFEINMSFGEVCQVVDSVVVVVVSVQVFVNVVQSCVDEVYLLVQYLFEKDLDCKIIMVQQFDIGFCEFGYIVMGCVQICYMYCVGGLFFLCEFNNE